MTATATQARQQAGRQPPSPGKRTKPTGLHAYCTTHHVAASQRKCIKDHPDCDLLWYNYGGLKDAFADHGDHLPERVQSIGTDDDLELTGLTTAFRKAHKKALVANIRKGLASVTQYKIEAGALFRLLEIEHGELERFIRDELNCDPSTMWRYVEVAEMLQEHAGDDKIRSCDIARSGIARLDELRKFPKKVRRRLLRGKHIYIDGEKRTLKQLHVLGEMRPLRKALANDEITLPLLKRPAGFVRHKPPTDPAKRKRKTKYDAKETSDRAWDYIAKYWFKPDPESGQSWMDEFTDYARDLYNAQLDIDAAVPAPDRTRAIRHALLEHVDALNHLAAALEYKLDAATKFDTREE